MDDQPPRPPHPEPPASADAGNRASVNGTELPEESTFDWLNSIPNGTIFSYNLDDSKTPGGLKVRWKIRVATGSEAHRWDTRQTEAIRELLRWATQHQQTR
jgi:hypothetical protein